jgi:hypothetical protein
MKPRRFFQGQVLRMRDACAAFGLEKKDASPTACISSSFTSGMAR